MYKMEFSQHTFAICAYKESKYLEECIKSVVNQEIKSKVIVATSTSNEYIRSICNKYNITIYERKGKSSIQDDWNFAYNMAQSKYVTIAHQDDIYDKEYTKQLKKYVTSNKKQIIFFTGYKEIKNGNVIQLTKNLRIKKLMLFPLKFRILRNKKFIRKMILSLGSPICCPSVTYNKDILGDKVFTSTMKCSLDWDTWYKLSKINGEFVYIDKYLTFHRIHEESETTNSIANNVRQNEDYEMYRKFWPKFIA